MHSRIALCLYILVPPLDQLSNCKRLCQEAGKLGKLIESGKRTSRDKCQAKDDAVDGRRGPVYYPTLARTCSAVRRIGLTNRKPESM